MVFNPIYNFLFVHIQKTAGTSITRALMNIPSSQFIAPAHWRLKDLHFIKENKPFIFAVVRNPFNRLVSWYEMMLRKNLHNDFSRYLLNSNHSKTKQIKFSEFIRRTNIIEETDESELGNFMLGKMSKTDSFELPKRYFKSISFNQADYLTDMRDQFMCDKVMRYENISTEWSVLVKELSLPIKSTLDFENVNPKLINIQYYYSSAEDIEWVEQLYKKDLELFEYKIP